MLRPRRAAVLATTFALTLLASVACTAGGSGPAPSASAIAPDAQIYISLGDSYAAGYQPSLTGAGQTTRDGFAYQLTDKLQADGMPLVLANYACSGVVSTTIVSEPGCAAAALGPGAPQYPDQTQAGAALALIKAHPGSVKLVTLAVGGNDIQPCLVEADPQTCVEQRLPVLRRNLDGLVGALRSALGDSVPIVGITYPDVYLGLYLKKDAGSLEVARRSREMFRTYLNPTLAQVYAAHGATFVDVTALMGAYGSFDDTEQLAPYGTVPVPVARVCQLTWYCLVGDVHANRQGHQLIAAAVLKAAQG